MSKNSSWKVLEAMDWDFGDTEPVEPAPARGSKRPPPTPIRPKGQAAKRRPLPGVKEGNGWNIRNKKTGQVFTNVHGDTPMAAKNHVLRTNPLLGKLTPLDLEADPMPDGGLRAAQERDFPDVPQYSSPPDSGKLGGRSRRWTANEPFEFDGPEEPTTGQQKSSSPSTMASTAQFRKARQPVRMGDTDVDVPEIPSVKSRKESTGAGAMGANGPMGRDQKESLKRAIREMVREVVRKKAGGGGYALYAPNKGKKKSPKPVGEFPTRLAAKNAELARFPPKDPEQLKKMRARLDKIKKDPKKRAAAEKQDLSGRKRPKKTGAPARSRKKRAEAFIRSMTQTLHEKLFREDIQTPEFTVFVKWDNKGKIPSGWMSSENGKYVYNVYPGQEEQQVRRDVLHHIQGSGNVALINAIERYGLQITPRKSGIGSSHGPNFGVSPHEGRIRGKFFCEDIQTPEFTVFVKWGNQKQLPSGWMPSENGKYIYNVYPAQDPNDLKQQVTQMIMQSGNAALIDAVQSYGLQVTPRKHGIGSSHSPNYGKAPHESLVRERLFHEDEVPGSPWDERMAALHPDAISSDRKLHMLHRGMEKACIGALGDASKSLTKVMRGMVKVHPGDISFDAERKKTFMPVMMDVDGFEIGPVHLYIDGGHLKIEVSKEAREAIAQLEPDTARDIRGGLMSFEEDHLPSISSAQKAWAARDAYLDKLHGRLEKHAAGLSGVEHHLMKSLLTKGGKRK